MKPSFSIRRLMALVLIFAVGLAAAIAGAFWFAVVTFSATTLGAARSRGPSRAFFAGCSAFGWASMLVFFRSGNPIRSGLPTLRPIIHAYEAINGPWPTVFKSPDEANRSILLLVETLNRVITAGHSLIALALAAIGGAVCWLIARRRSGRAGRGEGSPSVGDPAAGTLVNGGPMA